MKSKAIEKPDRLMAGLNLGFSVNSGCCRRSGWFDVTASDVFISTNIRGTSLRARGAVEIYVNCRERQACVDSRASCGQSEIRRGWQCGRRIDKPRIADIHEVTGLGVMDPFVRPRAKKDRTARRSRVSEIVSNRNPSASRGCEVNPLCKTRLVDAVLIENVILNPRIRAFRTPYDNATSVILIRNGVVGNDPIRRAGKFRAGMPRRAVDRGERPVMLNANR